MSEACYWVHVDSTYTHALDIIVDGTRQLHSRLFLVLNDLNHETLFFNLFLYLKT